MPHSEARPIAIYGECHPQFEPFRDAFEANFLERNELGASVAIYLEGERVVDLWAGDMDAARTRPWERDTIVTMASVVKGMLALALAMLVDRGAIDYDRPVADYWPDFAQAGKAGITVREAISHHAAIHMMDHAAPGDFFRFDQMAAAIAKQTPEWAVGKRGVYHTITIVFILQKLIEVASGERAWDFFRREITEALDVDYHIRFTEAELERFSADIDTEHFFKDAPASMEVMERFIFRALGDPGKDLSPDEQLIAPLIKTGGNARGAGKLFAYAAQDGEIAGKRVLSNKTIAQLTQVQWYEPCAIWGTPMRTALGVLLNDPKFFYIGPNPDAFGTAGGGGSFAMADRQNRMAVSYSLNRWWPSLALGDRARRLVDAAYASLPTLRGIG